MRLSGDQQDRQHEGSKELMRESWHSVQEYIHCSVVVMVHLQLLLQALSRLLYKAGNESTP